MEAKILKNLMEANEAFADQIRAFREERRLPMLNLIGGPGCGKTALLEATAKRLKGRVGLAVIEGDIATPRDAERIAAAGAESIQINTGGSCHLEANLVLNALQELELEAVDLVVVENVGNLVCPAEFDIGEDVKVGILSVTEGEDKPLKYPLLFREADVVVLSKIDLLEHVPFDCKQFYNHLKRVNGVARVFEVSALTGEGMDEWLAWMEGQVDGAGATGMPPGFRRTPM